LAGKTTSHTFYFTSLQQTSDVKLPRSQSGFDNVFIVKPLRPSNPNEQNAGSLQRAARGSQPGSGHGSQPTDFSSSARSDAALCTAWLVKRLALHIPWAARLKQYFEICSFTCYSEMVSLTFIGIWLILLSALNLQKNRSVDGNI